MAYFEWLGQERELSPAALTVRAQTVSPNDDGRLLWDVFMPPTDAASVRIANIVRSEIRYVTDRREWNARGRLVPQPTPRVDELEMVPIEGYFTVGEREIQALEERTLGNQQLFRQILGVDIPSRTDQIATANYRRLELDAFSAWANGTITAMNAQTGVTGTFSFGFAADRYVTAATPWSDVGVNAYDELVASAQAAINKIGPIRGVMLRQATLNAIVADSPQVVAGITPTRSQIEQLVADALGIGTFRFYVNERTLRPFTDGGIATAEQYVWPAEKVAFVPAGTAVGATHFAPIARAMQLARSVPAARIDIRRNAVFYEISNGGRQLTVEVQMNAMPIPDEQLLYVVDAGV